MFSDALRQSLIGKLVAWGAVSATLFSTARMSEIEYSGDYIGS